MVSEEVSKLVDSLIQKYDGHLISVLENIQLFCNYLPSDYLREVSKQLELPLRDVYGAATFYKTFYLNPRGKHICTVCLGTACHVRGGNFIIEEFERQLHIKRGKTTEDNNFTLETVNCMGACAVGPIVIVDGTYYSYFKTLEARKIIRTILKESEKVDITKDKRIFPVKVNCPKCYHSLMDNEYLIDGHPSVKVTISFLDKHGWYRLSCLYGVYNVESEYERPHGVVANYFCPHCHAEMLGTFLCPLCTTQMVSLVLTGGGSVHVCPMRGCKGHLLDV